MEHLSRRSFVTLLFGSAAALAVSRLPVLPEGQNRQLDIIKVPALKPFAHRSIRFITIDSETGGYCSIIARDMEISRQGVGRGGMLFWHMLPEHAINLLPESLFRIDFRPLQRPPEYDEDGELIVEPMRMKVLLEGYDMDDLGEEKLFGEEHVICGDQVSKIAYPLVV